MRVCPVASFRYKFTVVVGHLGRCRPTEISRRQASNTQRHGQNSERVPAAQRCLVARTHAQRRRVQGRRPFAVSRSADAMNAPSRELKCLYPTPLLPGKSAVYEIRHGMLAPNKGKKLCGRLRSSNLYGAANTPRQHRLLMIPRARYAGSKVMIRGSQAVGGCEYRSVGAWSGGWKIQVRTRTCGADHSQRWFLP